MDKYPQRRGFASMDRKKMRSSELPSLEQATHEAERHRREALEAIAREDYRVAGAHYHILIAQGYVMNDNTLIIEGKLRLAGITHKMGDDQKATALIVEAMAHKEMTGTDFDFHQFLKDAKDHDERAIMGLWLSSGLMRLDGGAGLDQ